MSYQVLARKWRPRTFEELIGQAHVVKALVNSLARQRLHHAYLFTGTRGVGKTTVARLLAKALSCERGVSAQPCGLCSACQEIDEGRYLDLVEVDAASRTKVDETRDLLENVQYAPSRGPYKVYLIDEVHMFSNHSFNALLKTLEEPPAHVKFLLATTDPKKLPVTILSRCLQFNLKRVGVDALAAHIEHVLAWESVASDAASRLLLAKAADGSVRDALSLLDQAIAYCGGTLREADVSTLLGTVDQGQVLRLLQLLAAHDPDGVLGQVAALADFAPDYGAILSDLLSALHGVAVRQILAADSAQADGSVLAEVARLLTAEDVQLFYQIGLIGLRDLPLAPDPRRGLEMVLLRMLAFQRETPRQAAAAPPDRERESSATRAAPERSAAVAPPAAALEWPATIERLNLNGLLREFAAHCVFIGYADHCFNLSVPPSVQHLRNEKLESRLESLLRKELADNTLRLRVSVADPGSALSPAAATALAEQKRMAAARAAIEQDPNVAALCESFDARIEAGSIAPQSRD